MRCVYEKELKVREVYNWRVHVRHELSFLLHNKPIKGNHISK